ncbi:MAG: glycosyltransferase family 2 protein [Gemmataceae bacterium]|nr:glycosyltransferase family 2 protein [Gemmataceae bacterium]
MISVVIPVLDERESLRQLAEEIRLTGQEHDLEIEIIFVDDGSTDGSWEVIQQLAREYPRIRGIRFRRNFGKAAALSAGFHAAQGDPVLSLDADLQDDPREIPRFLKALDEGLDVVSGWKKIRHDPWHKVIPSRIFNWAVGWLTGVRLHDHNCGMKCYRAAVFREVRLYGELHRFIPVLAAARGFRVGELEIQHRPRPYGRSKYGLERFIKGFLDLLTVKFLTSYSHRPQHVLGTIGLLAFVLGGLGMTWLAMTWIVNEWRPGSYPPLHQRPLLIYSVAAVLLGLQMLTMGFLAELMTAHTAHLRDEYSIAETTDGANAT